MNGLFAGTPRKLREERGLSRKDLGQRLLVNHFTVARWGNGCRLPDIAGTGFIWPLEEIEYAK